MKKLNTKFKALIGLSILTAGLGGCGSNALTPTQIEKVSSWCSNFGGTKEISSGFIAGLRARCMDGTLIIQNRSA